MGVEEDSFDDADLPARVSEVRVSAHQCGSEDDGQVVRVHACYGLIVRHTMKVKC
jgi:hypothetical protein